MMNYCNFIHQGHFCCPLQVTPAKGKWFPNPIRSPRREVQKGRATLPACCCPKHPKDTFLTLFPLKHSCQRDGSSRAGLPGSLLPCHPGPDMQKAPVLASSLGQELLSYLGHVSKPLILFPCPMLVLFSCLMSHHEVPVTPSALSLLSVLISWVMQAHCRVKKQKAPLRVPPSPPICF